MKAKVVVLFDVFVGVIGCSVTACVDKCSCCTSMTLRYYDGSWMNCDSNDTRNNNAYDEEELSEEEVSSSDDEEVRGQCIDLI